MTRTEIAHADNNVEWDQYVLQHPGASGYERMGWRRVIDEVFGHNAYYLLARGTSGKVQGVLPLVLLSSRIFGRFLVSMPFVNYGGVLADNVEAQRVLLDAALELRNKTGASHIELRHTEPAQIDWPCKQHKVSMRLELPAEYKTLWKAFSSKLRSQIRRASKENMQVQVGRAELADAFYEVFSRNMRDLGTPVYSRAFFLAILRHFPTDAHVAVVMLGTQPIAAGFLYGFRTTLEIIWASSDRRYNRLSPNMLLYGSVLEYACQQGFRTFDFGRSTPDSGTYRFKEQWGAKPVPLHWYYGMDTGQPLPDLSPSNKKYELAIALWRRMPLALTRRLGPRIVRFIP